MAVYIPWQWYTLIVSDQGDTSLLDLHGQVNKVSRTNG